MTTDERRWPTRRAVLLGTAGAAAATVGSASTQALGATDPGWQSVSAASGFEQIRALQYLLWTAGIKVTFESTYGAATRASVAAYQRKIRATSTGRADGYTISRLCPVLTAGRSHGAVFALATLLNRHGYQLKLSSTVYGTQLDRNVRAFQTAYDMWQHNTVGATTWRQLFFGRPRPPLYALRQSGTGAAQWANCGPVAMISILLSLRKPPIGWDGLAADRTAAVQHLRYTTMGLANTPARNAVGTEFFEIQPAFAKYGVGCFHGGINDTIRLARAGKASICGGDVYQMPYAKQASGPASHWVAVLGVNATGFLVADPLSTASDDVIHVLSEAQLRKYAATNPGYYPGHPRLSPPNHNSVCLS